MKEKCLTCLLCVLLCFPITACSGVKDGDGMVYEETEKTTNETGIVSAEQQINLSVLPQDCVLVPFETFKEGFSLVSNISWEEPPPTYEELSAAFGTEGIYYPNCDLTESGVSYKTYAWFSDEDWLESKVAIAIVFKAPKETDEYVYWSYTSQGITYEDVQ